MLFHISHTTTYTYSEAVSLCHNLVHLTPRDTEHQTCLSSELHIQPDPQNQWTGADYFGNPITFFTLQAPHRKLTITTMHLIRVESVPTVDRTQSLTCWQVRQILKTQHSVDVLEAVANTYPSVYIPEDRELADFGRDLLTDDTPYLQGVMELTSRIHREFRYDPSATTVTTPLRTVLKLRRGVCQDFAHLQIGVLRAMGLPARYISGYLRTIPAPGTTRLRGVDASHAWVAAWDPNFGWVGFDPTNNMATAMDHIVLCWGRDYDDVAPVRGVILGGGIHEVVVGVDVSTEEEPESTAGILF